MAFPSFHLICGDCLEILKDFPDNSVDLVLTDPPYGIGISSNPVRQRFNKSQWDNTTPTKEYFQKIMRVGVNQIIWGGNYFIEHLRSSKHYLIWNKLQPENFTLGMCEMAWSSFDMPAKMFTQSVQVEGNLYHTTQKPLNLMLWTIGKYSSPTDLILDPFCGSGTTCVAAEMLGRKWIGIDISEEYCQIARDRIKAVRTGVPVAEQRKGQKGLFE